MKEILCEAVFAADTAHCFKAIACHKTGVRKKSSHTSLSQLQHVSSYLNLPVWRHLSLIPEIFNRIIYDFTCYYSFHLPPINVWDMQHKIVGFAFYFVYVYMSM